MKIACFTALRRIELLDAPEPRTPTGRRRPAANRPRWNLRLRCPLLSRRPHRRSGRAVSSHAWTRMFGHGVGDRPAVRGLAAGDRVAVDPAFSCGICDQCLAGRRSTCRRLMFTGRSGTGPWRGAQRYVAPAAACTVAPASVSQDEAMLAEPLSIGLHAVRLSRLAAGMKIGILGRPDRPLRVALCESYGRLHRESD